jgi:hypothetical protein
LDRIFGRVVSVSEPAVPVDANVVRPKIDNFLLSELGPQNNPDAHDFLIRRGVPRRIRIQVGIPAAACPPAMG